MSRLTDYVTIAEAAASLGVSRQRVHQVIETDAIPTRSLAGRVLLLRAQVERLRRRTPRPPGRKARSA